LTHLQGLAAAAPAQAAKGKSTVKASLSPQQHGTCLYSRTVTAQIVL
jgi:hypothetical protein